LLACLFEWLSIPIWDMKHLERLGLTLHSKFMEDRCIRKLSQNEK